MPFITPITDRTITDDLDGTDKSFFNVVDWIRIYGNTAYVRALMVVLRGINVDYEALAEPTTAVFPSADDMNAFIQNIENIRTASGLGTSGGLKVLKADYEAIENSEVPDFEDVNDWERNLSRLKSLTIAVSVYLVFCGVAGCGQARHWQNRYRNFFIQPVNNPVRRPLAGVAECGSGMTRQHGFRRYTGT